MIGNKQRTDHSERAEVLEVIGEVKEKNVLMVDDFTITGNSLISMADLLKRRGALDIYAAVTHGVLSKGAGPRIAASPIKRLFITDTIETVQDRRAAQRLGDFSREPVRQVDPLDTRPHERSSLFPDTKAQGQKVARRRLTVVNEPPALRRRSSNSASARTKPPA